jgi:hypothetical protein
MERELINEYFCGDLVVYVFASELGGGVEKNWQ